MTVELIILTFLEKQKDQSPEYKEAVESLAQTIDRDGKLETDGNLILRDEGFLSGSQSSWGWGVGAWWSTILSSLTLADAMDPGPHPGLDDELCRRIGAQLAELGDRFEREALIKQEVVESLINEILDDSLTESRFEAVVQSLLKNIPAGIEQEKASLTVAMLLTRKIGDSIPSLLCSCFSTTASFIRGNFNSYLESLARQVRNPPQTDSCTL
ncbi:PREDICTED: BH3-interacting domain death agonist-like [Nanorana parkeri]|uniref:BH3-interacting domain death agonist-like n=1 Tax=Nanorana parkeri TaxID=125878 RepID=UPI0008549F5D|nr:PREDICTED: BH3-interacting domain death agonist-like [Nanorana parkeri]